MSRAEQDALQAARAIQVKLRKAQQLQTLRLQALQKVTLKITRLRGDHAFDQLARPDDGTPYTVREAVDTFEFGLQRLLDGIEVYIASRARTTGSTPPRKKKSTS